MSLAQKVLEHPTVFLIIFNTCPNLFVLELLI